jgi:hypothetical protein
MRNAIRALAAAAVLTFDGALLARWAARPSVSLEPGETVAFISSDGLTAVVESPRGRRLVRAGKILDETGPGGRLPLVAAQLPLLLGRSQGARLLLLGWDGGTGAVSALAHPVAAVDVVEPRAGLVEASLALESGQRRALADPRLRLLRRGYAEHLSAPGPAYDAVVFGAEAGEDLLRLAKSRLRPDGLLAVPVPVAEFAGPEGLPARLRAALRHYPRASVWSVVDGRGVLLAGRRKLAAGKTLDASFARPSAWLKPLGLSYPATLLSLEAAGERTARALAFGAGENLRPFALDDRATPDGRRRLLLDSYLSRRARPLQPREYLEILLHPRRPEERPVFRGLLEEWVSRFPREPRAVAFLLVVEEQEGHAARASALRSRLYALRRKRGERPRGEIVIPAG